MTRCARPGNGNKEGPGHAPGVSTKEHRRTVKNRKSRTGAACKAACRQRATRTAKPAGKNVTSGVTEAARLLKEWGWIVGKVDDPDLPFNLIAHRGRETLSVLVIRTRKIVMNAAGVAAYHAREVLSLQPFWESDTDNIQFWLFSRVTGLLRYRVFRGGIWNIETMEEGWEEKRKAKAAAGSGAGGAAVQKSRTSRGAASPSWPATGPDYGNGPSRL